MNNRERERRQELAALFNSAPIGPDLPGQKFPRGSRVKVAEKLPPGMAHFRNGFEAIVAFVYSQKYNFINANDIENYCLVMLDGDLPVNQISWYPECCLTLVSEDIGKGLEILKEYGP